MSDGPDKTLQMHKRWQALARAAARDAYETVELRERLERAVEEDCRREVTPAFLNALRKELDDGRQASLFAEDRLNRLDALRRLVAGNPLGGVIIDCAIEVATEGLNGPGTLREAVKRALLQRAQSGTRQVETHYRYEATEEDLVNVRRRSDTAIEATDFGRLAARIIGEEPKPPARGIQRRTGIEEGPPL